MRSTLAHSCFVLIRLVPLLEALQSGIASPVGDVVMQRLVDEQAADADLIKLSDYLEASRWRSGAGEDQAGGFEFRIALMCLIASGAGEPAWGTDGAGLLRDAVGLWRSVDAARDRMLGLAPAAVGEGVFVHAEREWQEREQSMFASSDVARSAVSEYAARLEGDWEPKRAELTRLAAECGWRPTGPCGSACDWPVCEASPPECIESRRWKQQTIGARLRRKLGAAARNWYLEVLYYEERADGGAQEELMEIGPEGYELRKIAGFDQGYEIADSSRRTNRCFLGHAPVVFEELSARSDLVATEISAADFEHRWFRELQGRDA